ncbi:unnamed protein product [Ambrosiozyma monospora]|uniref:Unnamed protein product n=1 Tax=Ambrosiozyma monospora TaxID=43982 RepID=A0ACB5SWL3_AMBMO|nr:unnamed protein product [Ambrosiozyma monospora]
MEVRLIVMKYVLVLNFNLLNDLVTILGLFKLNDTHINECLRSAIPWWCIDQNIKNMPLFKNKGALIKELVKNFDV